MKLLQQGECLGARMPNVDAADQTLGYFYFDEHPPHSCSYLVPAILRMAGDLSASTRVLDVGCGNGAISNELLTRGVVWSASMSVTAALMSPDVYTGQNRMLDSKCWK